MVGYKPMYQSSSNPFLAKPIPKGVIEQAILQSSSMSSAVQLVGCSYNTFKKYAKRYGLWNPNQSGKGIGKSKKYSNVIVDDGLADRLQSIFE